MKRNNCILTNSLLLLSIVLLQSCSTLFNLPVGAQKSTLGEVTTETKELQSMPPPTKKIVVGVYKFRDQTGQYKPTELGSNWSTAIPQGTTSILIKALEDSNWFIPIERENIGNLLNERQIIRSTRQEYATDPKVPPQALPPLLYAGVLLEGGVISYDSNVMTGGIGARYFGIGGATQYRQDRITVYLRAVSTLTGEILKTVYTSKNILSTSINGSFFKYIDTERLMESEVGVTQNEPIQLAVSQAIEKAVKTLIIEGIQDNIWGNDMDLKSPIYAQLAKEHKEENKKNENRLLGDKYPNTLRSFTSLLVTGEMQQINGDYKDAEYKFGNKLGFKIFITPKIGLELSGNFVSIKNKGFEKRDYYGPEVNLEYMFFPQFKLTPFAYGGLGTLFSVYKPFYKAQIGGGIDYLIGRAVSIRLYSQYDFGFQDKLDGLIAGKQNDRVLRFGVGLNIYLGN